MKKTLPVAVTLASSLAALPAFGQVDTQACVAAYEEVQADRQAGSLVTAREKALYCAQTDCPDVTKTDCSRWLTELESAVPTVTFQASDASGNDTTQVKVFYDDKPLKESLDGKAVPVDPGEHKFRFEIAGSDPIERVLTIREGEKNRMVDVSFGSGPAGQPPPVTGGGDDLAGDDGGVSPLAYVFGGLGLVGIGMFATFAILGTSEKSDLEAPVEEGGCSPNCTDEQVDSVRTKLIVADVSLAVGVVSLGVAAYFIISAAMDDDSSAATASSFYVGAEPRDGGGYGVVGGRF